MAKYLFKKGNKITLGMKFPNKKKPVFLNGNKGWFKKGNPSGNHKGIKHTELTRREMSINRSGKNNSFWKGGVTKENDKIRCGIEWRFQLFCKS